MLLADDELEGGTGEGGLNKTERACGGSVGAGMEASSLGLGGSSVRGLGDGALPILGDKPGDASSSTSSVSVERGVLTWLDEAIAEPDMTVCSAMRSMVISEKKCL